MDPIRLSPIYEVVDTCGVKSSIFNVNGSYVFKSDVNDSISVFSESDLDEWLKCKGIKKVE